MAHEQLALDTWFEHEGRVIICIDKPLEPAWASMIAPALALTTDELLDKFSEWGRVLRGLGYQFGEGLHFATDYVGHAVLVVRAPLVPLPV